MILDSFLNQLVAGFVEAQKLGTTLDQYVAEFAAAHPEFADDSQKLRDALAQALEDGTFIPLVTGSLAGVLAAIRAGHGEVGRHSSHSG